MATKNASLEYILEQIQSGDVIATGMYGNEPRDFLNKLHTIAERVNNVFLWTMSIMHPYPVLVDNSLKGKIDIYTYFCSPHCKSALNAGRVHFFPLNLHYVGQGIVESKPPSVFVAAVSPPDEKGNVYMSFDLQSTIECMESARLVVFEINKQVSRVYGETAIPLERADFYYEADYPLPEIAAVDETPEHKEIAEYTASLINDGDCIQLGIGGIPNIVGKKLLTKNDLGIHTEMITSVMGNLIENGNVTNKYKTIDTGISVGAFVWADKKLYDLISENESVNLRRASYTNNPEIIVKNDNVVSVNTAVQIDLSGQVCSESVGYRQYSGTGGATDFAYGAYHSKGGRGIIALPATAKNGEVSKIVGHLDEGAAVSISRNLVDYVITEYGAVRLKGCSIRERAQRLISIAHPDFREELRVFAKKYLA